MYTAWGIIVKHHEQALSLDNVIYKNFIIVNYCCLLTGIVKVKEEDSSQVDSQRNERHPETRQHCYNDVLNILNVALFICSLYALCSHQNLRTF
jgi:hypothetical protein